MTSYEFDWVDAFTDTPFCGNGCAVVHDAGAFSAETCMAFVRETSLVECTFLEPSSVADIKIRYFVAIRELPFAGHPTVASVASMARRGMISFHDGRAEITIETGAGLIPISVEDGPVPRVTMTQNAPEFGAQADPARIAALYGLGPDAIVGTPQIVSTGIPFCVTVLRDHDALREAKLEPARLDDYRKSVGMSAADVLEPYLVTLQGADRHGHTFSRLLLPPPMPAEDPFTGSATGCAASYLWRHGLISSPRYAAQQGHWMGRPGHAEVEVLGPPDAIGGVRITGAGTILMQGTLAI